MEPAARPAVASAIVRHTDFRALMVAHFGVHRAASVAGDHVFSELDGHTVNEALQAGMSPKKVWAAVCESFDVPESLRHGLPD